VVSRVHGRPDADRHQGGVVGPQQARVAYTTRPRSPSHETQLSTASVSFRSLGRPAVRGHLCPQVSAHFLSGRKIVPLAAANRRATSTTRSESHNDGAQSPLNLPPLHKPLLHDCDRPERAAIACSGSEQKCCGRPARWKEGAVTMNIESVELSNALARARREIHSPQSRSRPGPGHRRRRRTGATTRDLKPTAPPVTSAAVRLGQRARQFATRQACPCRDSLLNLTPRLQAASPLTATELDLIAAFAHLSTVARAPDGCRKPTHAEAMSVSPAVAGRRTRASHRNVRESG
jgi:hypothetical protein